MMSNALVPVLQPPQLPNPIGNKQSALSFLDDTHLDDDKQWKLMLDYFTKNPEALMDALPTPRADDEDEQALGDFRTGLTPKKGFSFKFGNERSGSVNRPSTSELRRTG